MANVGRHRKPRCLWPTTFTYLAIAILLCARLLWFAVKRLLPNLRRDIDDDGLSVAISAFSGFWIASWSVLKLIILLLLPAAFITGAYHALLWVLE